MAKKSRVWFPCAISCCATFCRRKLMRGGWPCNLLKSLAALLILRVFRTAAQNQVTFHRRYGKWEFEYAVPYRYAQNENFTFFPIADQIVLGNEKTSNIV